MFLQELVSITDEGHAMMSYDDWKNIRSMCYWFPVEEACVNCSCYWKNEVDPDLK
jgi:hypothetical protein